MSFIKVLRLPIQCNVIVTAEIECNPDDPCHEGAADVISKSTILRIVLYFLIVFLVSGCTIVVLVSELNYFCH